MEENFVARQFPIGSVSKEDQKHALFQLRLAIIYAEYIICSLASFSRGHEELRNAPGCVPSRVLACWDQTRPALQNWIPSPVCRWLGAKPTRRLSWEQKRLPRLHPLTLLTLPLTCLTCTCKVQKACLGNKMG